VGLPGEFDPDMPYTELLNGDLKACISKEEKKPEVVVAWREVRSNKTKQKKEKEKEARFGASNRCRAMPTEKQDQTKNVFGFP
jgi:hypothetical protein